MAVLDFPASPSVGQLYTATNGFVYQWDGAAWTLSAAGLAKPAALRITRTTTLALPAASTAIPFTATQWPTLVSGGGLSWVVGSPTRLTVTEDGIYMVTASLSCSGTSGVCHYMIQIGGAVVCAITTSAVGYQTLSALCSAIVGSYFEFVVLPATAFTMDPTFHPAQLCAAKVR